MSFSYQVTLSDPSNSGGANDPILVYDLQQALSVWSKYIVGLGTLVLQLDIESTPSGRESGGPTSSAFVGTAPNGNAVYESSAEYELKTGQHVSGNTSDITVTIDPGYFQYLDLQSGLSYSSPVPSNEYNPIVVFLHEIMHGLGQSGWYSQSSVLPGNYESNFDTYTVLEPNGTAYWTGPHAEAVYGGPVPITSSSTAGENYYHFGNTISDSTRQPATVNDPLSLDLMNGIVFFFDYQYPISALDLGVLADLGYTLTNSSYTVASAISAYAGNASIAPMAVLDTASNVTSGLDQLEIIGSNNKIESLVLSDPTNFVHATVAQLSTDAVVLSDISGSFNLEIDNSATAFSYTLASNVHELDVTGSGAASVYGNGIADTIWAGTGKDVLVLTSSGGTAVGGTGNDYLYGSTMGTSVLYGGTAGLDVLVARGANTTMYAGGGGFRYMFAGSGSDALNATATTTGDIDVMFGSTGAVTMYGGIGMNYFYTGPGQAAMFGGSGENIYVTAAETTGETIVGGSGANYLYAGNHGDTIIGGARVDVFVGGAGNDTFTCGTGTDYAWGEAGANAFTLDSSHAGIFVVNDFGVAGSTDTVRLLNSGFGSFADVQSHEFYAAGINTTIITPVTGSAIWLIGVAPAQLSAGQFAFS